MDRLFSSGVVDVAPSGRFAFAALVGTTGWVGLATVRWLPVSTTHALVGTLIGAGLVADLAAVRWSTLAGGVAVPLFASVVLAYVLSTLLGVLVRRSRVEGEPRAVVPAPAVVLVVSVAMLAGTVVAGRQVVQRLGEDVTRLDDSTGLQINLTTAPLMGLGGCYGLPMSPTHVSTGAIAGAAGARPVGSTRVPCGTSRRPG